jgi:hypothetical protein
MGERSAHVWDIDFFFIRLTPKQDNKESLNEAFVGPIKGWWVLGVLFLDDPAVHPGNDVDDDHVEKAAALVRLGSESDSKCGDSVPVLNSVSDRKTAVVQEPTNECRGKKSGEVGFGSC